jgi:hypothetical protein
MNYPDRVTTLATVATSPDYYCRDAKHAAFKFVIASLTDPATGKCYEDLKKPLEEGKFNRRFLAHSYGWSFAIAVQNAARDIIVNKKDEFGIPSYPEDQLKEFFRSHHIMGIGMPIYLYEKPSQLQFSKIALMATTDLGAGVPPYVLGAMIQYSRKKKEAGITTLCHPQNHDEVWMLMSDIMPSAARLSTGKTRPNNAGHDPAPMAHELAKEYPETLQLLQKIIRGERPDNLANYLGDGNAIPMDRNDLEEIARSGNRAQFYRSVLQMMRKESKAWRRLEDGSEHPRINAGNVVLDRSGWNQGR